jgi:hypothetical protein
VLVIPRPMVMVGGMAGGGTGTMDMRTAGGGTVAGITTIASVSWVGGLVPPTTSANAGRAA